MSGTDHHVSKPLWTEFVEAIGSVVPPTEESQSLRETFREMVQDLIEYRELLQQFTFRDIRIR